MRACYVESMAMAQPVGPAEAVAAVGGTRGTRAGACPERSRRAAVAAYEIRVAVDEATRDKLFQMRELLAT